MEAEKKSLVVVVPFALLAASGFVGYGCKAAMGWEEPYLVLEDAGASGGGGEGGSAGQGGAGGVGGFGGFGGGGFGGGGGGMGGLGGAGGAGGSMGCTTAAECPAGMNGQATCVGGVCGFMCADGFGDCDGVVGCEENLANNRNHCGACGNACVAQCKGMACNDPVSIAAGAQHFCAILKDGELYCWGKNQTGELGDGTKISKTSPTKITLPGGTTALQVDGGGTNTCAVLSDKKVACWGTNVVTPTLVNGLTNIKQVAVGDTHYCAVDLVGKLFCWGYNFYGQVGTGTTTNQTSPVVVATSISYVDTGSSHTCAVGTNATVTCWGRNFNGQLGIGSQTNMLVPTAVPALAGVSRISCGDNHTCSLDAIGVQCWGGNSSGALGTGNIMDKNTPQALALNAPTTVSAGYGNTGAIATNELWMWGKNNNGKIGNGSQTDVYSPVKIAVSNSVALALASGTSCALIDSGGIRCWGDNTFGQFGDGTTTSKLTPTSLVWP